jgi:hypothetical protein
MYPIRKTSTATTLAGQSPCKLVLRKEQPPCNEEPVIHYGLIASANRFVKDAQVRDVLALNNGILCFEMDLLQLPTTCPAWSFAGFAAMQTVIIQRRARVCCVDRGSICEESPASYSPGQGRSRNDSPPKCLGHYQPAIWDEPSAQPVSPSNRQSARARCHYNTSIDFGIAEDLTPQSQQRSTAF